MNQRDSSGLPLRAAVMVLLFLGVVFLLVALQYMGPDDDDDGDSAVVSTTTSNATSSAKPSPEPDQADTVCCVHGVVHVGDQLGQFGRNRTVGSDRHRSGRGVQDGISHNADRYDSHGWLA